MKRLMTAAALVAMAGPAVAQTAPSSEEACNAVQERVQMALGRADRALQAENTADVERWTAIAANYSTVFETFCATDDES